MVLLNIIFYIFILSLSFGEITRFDFGNGLAIRLNEILLVIVVAVWFVTQFRKRKGDYFLAKPILIFSAIALLSLLINIRSLSVFSFFISFSYLLRWILYASLYFVVSSLDLQHKRKTLVLMLISGLAFVLMGYAQYFLYPNLKNLYYLGWDEHLYRMFSSFLDPNFTGVFFVLILLIVTGLIFHFKKLKDPKYLFFTFLGAITLGAVYLTYSRSALLALFSGVLSFLVLENKKRWILLLICISGIFFTIFSRNFNIENLNLLRTTSSKARLDSYSKAILIIEKNPVFGVGFNSYRFAQERYGFNFKNQIPSHAESGTDNSFLFVLATTGVSGLIAFLYLWGTVLKSLYSKTKEKNNFQNLTSKVAFASLIAVFTGSFFINAFFYPFIMEWIFILLGLSLVKTDFRENR